MQAFKDEKSTCSKCNVDLQVKETKPEHLDPIPQSLMVMFRIRELKVVECPCCGQRGMRI